MDIFIGNLPRTITARQLVCFLEECLQPHGFSKITGAPVLSCRVRTNSRATHAFVVFRSQAMADAVTCRTRILGGRKLRTGAAKRTRVQPLGISAEFKCRGLQLCAEWPPYELTCLWQSNSGVSLQVSLSPSQLPFASVILHT